MQAERGHGAPLSRGHRAGSGYENIVANPAGDLFEQTGLAATAGSDEHGWISGQYLYRDRAPDRAAIGGAAFKTLMPQIANPGRNGCDFIACKRSIAGTCLDGFLGRSAAYVGDENAGRAGHRFASGEPCEGQEDRNEKRFACRLESPRRPDDAEARDRTKSRPEHI